MSKSMKICRHCGKPVMRKTAHWVHFDDNLMWTWCREPPRPTSRAITVAEPLPEGVVFVRQEQFDTCETVALSYLWWLQWQRRQVDVPLGAVFVVEECRV